MVPRGLGAQHPPRGGWRFVAGSAAAGDAPAIVDPLIGQTLGAGVLARLDGCGLHAPAHLEVEVLSALGQLHRAGELATRAVGRLFSVLAAARIRQVVRSTGARTVLLTR